MVRQAPDGSWGFTLTVVDRSFHENGFRTQQAAESALESRRVQEEIDYVIRTVRVAADQTEIVFPTLSSRLKSAFKILTGQEFRGLHMDWIGDLQMRAN